MLTKHYFANYRFLESKIKSMRRRLKYFENHPLTGSHGVVKGSMQHFPFIECHYAVSSPRIKSAEERETLMSQLAIDLEGNLRLLEDMKLDIEDFIENSNYLTMEEQTIFRLKFIDRATLKVIGDELGYDKSVISRKIDDVIDRLPENNDENEISSRLQQVATKTTK